MSVFLVANSAAPQQAAFLLDNLAGVCALPYGTPKIVPETRRQKSCSGLGLRIAVEACRLHGASLSLPMPRDLHPFTACEPMQAHVLCVAKYDQIKR